MTKPLRKNVVLLRAGQNANRVLHVDLCEITPVSAETGRWCRMDSNPFARSILIIKDLRNQGSELPQKVTTHLPAFAPVLRICRCLEAPAFWQKVLVRGRQLQHKAQRIVGLETGRFGPEDAGGHARFVDNGMP